MDGSCNFHIDALLRDERPKRRSLSDEHIMSPGARCPTRDSCAADSAQPTTSLTVSPAMVRLKLDPPSPPRFPLAHAAIQRGGLVPKPGLLHASSCATLPTAMAFYGSPVYGYAASSQLPCAAFPALPNVHLDALKAPAGGLSLEQWLRASMAGVMLPRGPDYSREYRCHGRSTAETSLSYSRSRTLLWNK